MREFFLEDDYIKYTHVQLQLSFFVMAFVAYAELRSPWQVSLFLVASLWFDGRLLDASSVVAAIVGFALSVLTVKLLAGHPRLSRYSSTNVLKFVHVVLLPLLLIYLAPCYVEQTSFPVGVVMAFLAWSGIALIVSGVDGLRSIVVYLPIFVVFLASAILFLLPWLPLALTVLLQLAFVLRAKQVQPPRVCKEFEEEEDSPITVGFDSER